MTKKEYNMQHALGILTYEYKVKRFIWKYPQYSIKKPIIPSWMKYKYVLQISSDRDSQNHPIFINRAHFGNNKEFLYKTIWEEIQNIE